MTTLPVSYLVTSFSELLASAESLFFFNLNSHDPIYFWYNSLSVSRGFNLVILSLHHYGCYLGEDISRKQNLLLLSTIISSFPPPQLRIILNLKETVARDFSTFFSCIDPLSSYLWTSVSRLNWLIFFIFWTYSNFGWFPWKFFFLS
jgi:hypothetical protein